MRSKGFLTFLKNLRLRWKLTICVLGLHLALGTAFIAGVTSIFSDRLHLELEQKGRILTQYLSETVTDPILVNDLVQLQQHLERAVALEDDILYAYVGEPGKFPLAHTFKNGFPRSFLAGPSQPLTGEVLIELLETEKGIVRDFAAPVLAGGKAVLHVGLSEAHIHQGVGKARRILYTIIVFFSLVWVIAIFFLSRFVTRPLEELTKGAEAIGKGELDRRLPVETRDEIGHLAATFNAMTRNLAQLMEERLSAEKEIQETLTLFESIANGIGEGILLLDLDFRIIWANEHVLEHYQVQLDEIRGRACYEVTHNRNTPCKPPGDPCPILLQPDGGRPLPYEHVHYDREGNREMVEVTVYPLRDENGDVYQYLHITRDISERHEKLKLEDQLRQSQKMEAIGRLSGSMAHDFNNILTTIVGFSELGKLAVGEDDPLREKFESILQAGRRGAELTRQLLAFSRRQVIKTQVVSLHEVIADFSRLLHRLVGENVELELVSRAPDACIEVDPGQLEQVVMNLAVNAKEAMPEGGKLTIETGRTRLENYPDPERGVDISGNFVQLTVSDSGHGMDAELRGRIFEPFYTTKKEGTGLGLATVFGIVKQGGGYIDVESAPGKGTRFDIYFPEARKEEETAGQQEEHPGDQSGGSETILLVDDRHELVDLAAQALEPLGYHVLGATGAEEAQELSRSLHGRIDLLVTDIVMPGMNGVELARALRESRPEMKVIFVSGYADNHLGKDGRIDDSVPYLEKPVLPSELARTVREVLDSG
ncbi:MAG: hypothetical protein Kow0089_08180 [Desulfobulbaceae bacterium]